MMMMIYVIQFCYKRCICYPKRSFGWEAHIKEISRSAWSFRQDLCSVLSQSVRIINRTSHILHLYRTLKWNNSFLKYTSRNMQGAVLKCDCTVISNAMFVACALSTTVFSRMWLWGPPSLLSNGYRRLFPWGKAAGAWSWALTCTKCRGKRMSEAIPPFPQYALPLPLPLRLDTWL
jgi:hypothetical protein